MPDIAVLARSNNEGENQLRLIAEGLPVESKRPLNIAENHRLRN